MSCGCGSGTLTRSGGAACCCGGGCRCGGGTACSCGSAGLVSAGAVGGGGFLRPRFFAGQLLSEDDLQAIVAYTAGKSRLHARYLAGAGVVNGLEVTCHPSKRGWVRISAGYALDCCGEDIVVPCSLEVDVNQLIATMPKAASCDEPCPPDPAGRRIGRPGRRYVLTVSYAEEPAEYLSAYPVDDQPCLSSSGGGCEVSLTREGYRIGLRCGTAETPATWMGDDIVACLQSLCTGLPGSGSDGEGEIRVRSFVELIARDLFPCLDDLRRIFGRGYEGQPEDRQILTDLRQRMIELLERRGTTDCELLCEIAALTLDPAPEKAAAALKPLLLRVVAECVCRAVNPPPPECDDPEVVLATVEVSDCEVVEVCGLARRHVVSGPALGHWLPLGAIHTILECLCCGDLDPWSAVACLTPRLGPLELSILQQLEFQISRKPPPLPWKDADGPSPDPSAAPAPSADGPSAPAVDVLSQIDDLQRQIDELRAAVAAQAEATSGAAEPPVAAEALPVADPAGGRATGRNGRRTGNGGGGSRTVAQPPTTPAPAAQPPDTPPPATPTPATPPPATSVEPAPETTPGEGSGEAPGPEGAGNG